MTSRSHHGGGGDNWWLTVSTLRLNGVSLRSFPVISPRLTHSTFHQPKASGPKGRWSEAGRDRRERTGERHCAEGRGPPGVSRVPSFISRLLPSPVFHSGTLLLAWRLSPKSRKERGMLDLPWLAVELREWFASTRSTFLWFTPYGTVSFGLVVSRASPRHSMPHSSVPSVT